MPYREISELPENIKAVLSEHAQHIFKEAFNSAYEQYQDPDNRKTDDTLEEVAFKIAWSAVKRVYVKGDDDKWHELSDEN